MRIVLFRFLRVLLFSGLFPGLFLGALVATEILAFGNEATFHAEVDQNKVGLDDYISLRLTVTSDATGTIHEPQFEAPDFDVVGSSSSMSISQQYDSTTGSLSVVNQQQITKMLRPRKVGTFKIKGIRYEVEGKTITAPDIEIMVNKTGSSVRGGNGSGGTRPHFGSPSQFGSQNGQPQGSAPVSPLSGPKVDRKLSNSDAFIRAETEKKTAYRGEQVVVSYYLYHRIRLFNIEATKFPVLSGFLREDLDVPMMSPQGLRSETVEINGNRFERSLLAQYAAYPLELGDLRIDTMGLRFNYYAGARGGGPLDEEDPFFGFFQAMAPRNATLENDPIQIHVIPLPDQGRPGSFTGGVGQFEVSSAIDKYQVHANDAVTLKVKVEGKGNASSIQIPKAVWPSGIELYDSKGKSETGKNGVATKVFDLLLIPRTPGNYVLPALEFGFFDPKKGQYYIKSTAPVQLAVQEALPGTQTQPTVPMGANPSGSNLAKAQAEERRPEEKRPEEKREEALRPLKAPEGEKEGRENASWHWIYWAACLAFGVFALLVVTDLFKKGRGLWHDRKGRQSKCPRKNWDKLTEVARKAARNEVPWSEILVAYEGLTQPILDFLSERFGVAARSFSRSQLKEILTEEKKVPLPIWNRIEALLEFSERVRFAGASAAGGEEKARGELEKWVREGQHLVREMSSLISD